MRRELVVFDHHQKDRNVYICFAEFEDKKIVRQEEAILEEPELYEAVKHLLVKFKNK